jgi:hypothetical protein
VGAGCVAHRLRGVHLQALREHLYTSPPPLPPAHRCRSVCLVAFDSAPEVGTLLAVGTAQGLKFYPKECASEWGWEGGGAGSEEVRRVKAAAAGCAIPPGAAAASCPPPPAALPLSL